MKTIHFIGGDTMTEPAEEYEGKHEAPAPEAPAPEAPAPEAPEAPAAE